MTTRSTTRAVTRSTTRGTTSAVSSIVGPPSAPVFTIQPTNQTVDEGANATFTSRASGRPSPTYQWEVNDGGGWDTLSGATSRILTLADVTIEMDGYQYRNIATNTEGTDTSDVVTLTVTEAPVGDWILATGNWDDDGTWDDDALWDDGDLSYASYLLAMDYQSRLVAEGHAALSSDAFNLVVEVFQAAEDNGVSVTSGWLFGSEVNVDDRELQLNLVDDMPSIVPNGTLHADTTLSDVMIGLRVETPSECLTTNDESGLFSGDPDYSVLLLASYTGDAAIDWTQSSPNILLQEESTSVLGNISLYGSSVGGLQFIERGGTTIGLNGGTNGGSPTQREHNVDPAFCWWHIDDNEEFEFYHPSIAPSGTLYPWGDPSDKQLYLGYSSTAGDIGYMAFIRFDGDCTDEQRSNIFTRIYAKWRLLGKAILCVGNSVTQSGVSNAMSTWPKEVQRWGIYNSALVARRAVGAKRLPYFTPTGYALPGEPPDAEIAVWPLAFMDWFAANVVINDDQQNMIGSGQPWASWLHCHNAIVAHCAALNAAGTTRGIMCTQMAHPPFEFGTYDPMTYAEVVTNYGKFRDISILTRAATLSDFGNIPTAIADVYAAMNLGWDVGDDGDAPDPINDYPNGDVDLFATSDAQHPNDAGHAVLFGVFRDAIIEAIGM